MSLRNTENRWGALAQLLHWLTFFLVLGVWFAVSSAQDLPRGPERGEWMDLHKSLGVTVFFLIWARLAWRLANPTPKALGPSPIIKLVGAVTHWALYAVVIAMPLTALLANQFGGRSVSWFGIFEIPPFLGEAELGGLMMDLHKDYLWPALIVLVVAHAGAALVHHFVVKDDTMKRMLPGAKD